MLMKTRTKEKTFQDCRHVLCHGGLWRWRWCRHSGCDYCHLGCDCCHSGCWKHPLTVNATSWHWSILYIVYLDKFFKGVKAVFFTKSVSQWHRSYWARSNLSLILLLHDSREKENVAWWKPLIFIRQDCTFPSNISVHACHWHQFGTQRPCIFCA